MGYGFHKEERLRKRKEFLRIAKCGRRIDTRFFLIAYALGENQRSRLGVTVTKRIGPAVKRNRIKRLVKESFRLLRPHLSGIWDINIIAKKTAAQLTFKDAIQDIEKGFKRISRGRTD